MRLRNARRSAREYRRAGVLSRHCKPAMLMSAVRHGAAKPIAPRKAPAQTGGFGPNFLRDVTPLLIGRDLVDRVWAYGIRPVRGTLRPHDRQY